MATRCSERSVFDEAFGTAAHRVHAIELDWMPVMQRADLYRYSFDAAAFRPWSDASGQWISDSPIEPMDVQPVGDLVQRHADASIELRLVPNLWPIRDLAVSDRWDYSIVRISSGQAPPLTDPVHA